MTFVAEGGLMVLAAVSLIMAGLGFKVLLKLALRGPAAAEEAYERGDSITSWLDARQMPNTLDGPRDSERLSFAARRDTEHGEVMVEERASFPSFAQ